MKEHDYMNDPRLDEFKDAPLPLREVRAWRLAVQDRTQGMTLEQKDVYYDGVRERTDAFCAKHGLKLKYAESAATG